VRFIEKNHTDFVYVLVPSLKQGSLFGESIWIHSVIKAFRTRIARPFLPPPRTVCFTWRLSVSLYVSRITEKNVDEFWWNCFGGVWWTD